MDDKLGARLKAERRRLKLSQQEFGASGGVAANAQGNYEKGCRMPTSKYLIGIRTKGVDVLYVLTGERTAMSPEAFSAEDTVIFHHYRTLDVLDQKAIAQIAFSLSKSEI
ncbi:helix-turn-helix domain-containing protein [Pseudomonas sp. NA-150]|uniref:helix-turn-helix domain-containing protein n=1 Tax=Pseudomonas sp. NA-150 TaxID=3367525 RepID=UPI0037C9A47B